MDRQVEDMISESLRERVRARLRERVGPSGDVRVFVAGYIAGLVIVYWISRI